MAGCGLRQRLPQSLQLRLPADKARQAPDHCGLQTASQARDAGELECFYRLRETLDRYGAKRLEPHQALHQSQGGGSEANCTRRSQLLHARCQVRRLPHGRVVHVQVVADGAHYHFARVEANAHLQREP